VPTLRHYGAKLLLRYLVKDEPLITNNFGFFPWHPFITAREMVEKIDQPLIAAFGHWDKDDFGQNKDNLIPIEVLSKITTLAVSGHIHLPEEFEQDGVKVIMTGSMQPYNFGEDRNGDFYVTLTLDEIKDQDFSNKCVRIRLRSGEELPTNIDCLQLVATRFTEDKKQSMAVEFGEFDMKKVFEDVCSEEDVKEDIMKEVWSKYEEMRQ
jgi:DNA repair exonuclease SbcCD nuclease subunit